MVFMADPLFVMAASYAARGRGAVMIVTGGRKLVGGQHAGG
jgi:hypothetical protein